jgi:hypothetical protein
MEDVKPVDCRGSLRLPHTADITDIGIGPMQITYRKQALRFGTS